VISYDTVLESSRYVEGLLTSNNKIFKPSLGIICGTGLGVLGHGLKEVIDSIPYSDIPNFPQAALPGHSGRLCLGHMGEVPVAVMMGRSHLYQGFSAAQTAFPVRLLKLLGVERLIVTNVTGAVNKEYQVGDLVLIKDHINFPGLAGINPLRGPNDPRFGPRYFSISNAYSSSWRSRVEKLAMDMELSLRQGVYAAVGGPNFESVAEVRMLRMMEADIVGMSSIPEILTAVHSGMEVLALSLITNICRDSYDDVEEEESGFVQPVVDSKKVTLLELLARIVEDVSVNM